MMRVLAVLSFIWFLAVGLFAQQGAILKGQVTRCNEPGKNSSIQLIKIDNKQVTLTAETDEKGFYRFENVSTGIYFIRVGDKNYGPRYDLFDKNPLILSDGDLKEQNIVIPSNCELHEWLALPEIPQVFISAGTSQSIDEVSKTVNVINAQELRDRADFSLVESLRTIPGFRVQQLGGFGRLATIKTRGLRNQDTALLLDGIRFRDASSITGDASAFLSDITLTSVSRIEVLRGSGSSLYGTNAVGGTIDFQTPEPKPGWHGQVSANAGGLGLSRFRGNVSHGTDNGKFGFNIGLSRTDYRIGIDGDDDANNTNFQSRIEAKPFEKTNISVRFFASDAFVMLNSDPDTIFGTTFPTNAVIIDAQPGINFAFDANDPDNSQKSKFFNGQAVLTQIVNDELYLQGYYSGLRTDRRNENGLLGVPPFQSESTSRFAGTIHSANGHLDWTPNKANRITVGYEFEYEKFGNDGFTPDGSGDFFTNVYQSSHTIYAQDLIRLLDNKLQLAGGFRAQFFDLKTPDFSLDNAPYANLTLENPPSAYTFDGSASYFFEKTGTKLRVHTGNGYRVPSLYERFGTFFSSFGIASFAALGDPYLKPEKTFAFDAGIEQNLFDNRAKLTATYFYTKLIDTIGFGFPVPDIEDTQRRFGGYENQKGGIARGGEFSGEFRPTGSTDIFASYTYTNSDQRSPQVTGTSIISTLGVPANQFTLVATQRFKRFWVNFDFLATSSYLAPIFSTTFFNNYVYRFEGNRKADLTAGYTFSFNKDKFSLRLYGTIENLFDHEYYENGFRTAGINGRVGVSFGF